MSKTIEIVVAPDGQTRVETKGFFGVDCQEASRFVERALGQQTGETLKAEFYQTATLECRVRQPE
ncbi:MAG: hypothetical protein JWN70_1454 [Planctomycetaceae bacterium]|nr:hypothetical protein [Planctomycetaceae bacterium]